MRRLRERRKRRFRCLTVEICDADIDGLISRSFLDRIDRDDPVAVDVAMGRLLESIALP
jgi:hypothetical protein